MRRLSLPTVIGIAVLGIVTIALLTPSVRMGTSDIPKSLPIHVRVIDVESHQPIENAEVTFFRGPAPTLDVPIPAIETTPDQTLPSALTDHRGQAQLTGNFEAWVDRAAWSAHRWYRLGEAWLRVSINGQPVTYVLLDGQQQDIERDYDDDGPLEVLVVVQRPIQK